MDLTRGWPIRRYESGRLEQTADSVVIEARIELDVNDGAHRQAMLCLPHQLEALAVGFLCCEGVLQRRSQLAGVRVLADEGRILVRGDFDADILAALAERWTWGSGCGSGGTSRDLDSPAYERLTAVATVSAERLMELAREFQSRAELWKRTGGVHAAALASSDGIEVFAEDIGRHNAFDKVIGKAMLDGIDLAGKFVLTTGRLSAEIVSKAIASGVGMLASRSAVTSLGIKLARRFGVTLVGFLRGRRFNVYSGDDRICDDAESETEGDR